MKRKLNIDFEKVVSAVTKKAKMENIEIVRNNADEVLNNEVSNGITRK